MKAQESRKQVQPMPIMTLTWPGLRWCGIPLMSISFMSSLMPSSVAMVSLKKVTFKMIIVENTFIKPYPRLSTTNIRKYRVCLINVGLWPTFLSIPWIIEEFLLIL